MGYDIIGDIHGHADHLESLLDKLGYQIENGVWSHPTRKVIFCGDFINRGPKIVETIHIVRSMCEAGNAMTVLGNHEFSLILWHAFKEKKMLPPALIRKAGNQSKTTRDAYKQMDLSMDKDMKWLRKQALFLDLPELRVVHACWDQQAIDAVVDYQFDGKLKKSILRRIVLQNEEILQHISRIVQGPIMNMPSDLKVVCNRGLNRKSFRVKWWCNPLPTTFGELCFEGRYLLPNYTIPSEVMPQINIYDPSEPTVFCGHYCRSEGAQILSRNVVCVDSCISHSGILSAYRYNPDELLSADHIVTVIQ